MVNEQKEPLPIILIVSADGKIGQKMQDMINNKIIADSYDIQIVTLEELRVREPNQLDLVVFDEIAQMHREGLMVERFCTDERNHKINHQGKGPRNKWGKGR